MSLDERFFQVHGHYPDGMPGSCTICKEPAPLPPHVTREAIMAVLDGRITELREVQTWLTAHVPDAPNCQALKASIRALEWAKAELTVLIECPATCLTPEQHRRAEAAYQDAEAARHYTED